MFSMARNLPDDDKPDIVNLLRRIGWWLILVSIALFISGIALGRHASAKYTVLVTAVQEHGQDTAENKQAAAYAEMLEAGSLACMIGGFFIGMVAMALVEKTFLLFIPFTGAFLSCTLVGHVKPDAALASAAKEYRQQRFLVQWASLGKEGEPLVRHPLGGVLFENNLIWLTHNPETECDYCGPVGGEPPPCAGSRRFSPSSGYWDFYSLSSQPVPGESEPATVVVIERKKMVFCSNYQDPVRKNLQLELDYMCTASQIVLQVDVFHWPDGTYMGSDTIEGTLPRVEDNILITPSNINTSIRDWQEKHRRKK